jgi:hypothetical protein
MKKFNLLILLAFYLLTTSCNKASNVTSDPKTEIKELIDKKCFYQALKAMPEAMLYFDKEQKEISFGVKDLPNLNNSNIFSLIANAGEKDWGKILDDPDIPYEQKTNLLYEIIKCKLGKGSIYLYNSKNYILPIDSPIVIQNTSLNVILVTEQDLFPASWLKSPIDTEAEPLNVNEIDRSKNILIKALNKYPAKIINSNLDKIFVMKRLKFRGIYAGGTNSKRNVYIVNRGINEGSIDIWVEAVFHAEFSSILLKNFPKYLNKKTWLNINDEEFKYGGGGVEEIREKKSNETPDIILNTKGFINEYAMSSLENDFNSIVKRIFIGDNHFWELVKKHPKLEKKMDLVIEFYSKLDPMFNKAYFLAIKQPE